MSYVDEVLAELIEKNPAEPEFHQAAKEVLESLRPVVEQNEEKFRKDALLERLVNPERQIKFRVPWVDDKGQVHICVRTFLQSVFHLRIKSSYRILQLHSMKKSVRIRCFVRHCLHLASAFQRITWTSA